VTTRWQDAEVSRGAEYDARWEEMASSGDNIHGEADLVGFLLAQTGGHRVLDAGCGTGRVAVELSRRGVSVAAVDADPLMLDAAREKAPQLSWARCDLADGKDLARVSPGPFDLILLAGNVMIFLAPDTEQQVLANLAGRLAPGGLLVAGFSLIDDLTATQYDALAAGAGLQLMHRWATWDRQPFADGDYAVSVHRR
jgi:SAM-dependent methyltransferase